MAQAEVGDDLQREDPTVLTLEREAAELLGKASAIYCSSGTQCNLLAVLSQCDRGDELIAGQQAHIYHYEGGGASVFGGVMCQPVPLEADGTLDLDRVRSVLKAPLDLHPRSRLLCIENTHNGKALPLKYLNQLRPFGDEHGLKIHCDGARIFNAAIHFGVEASTLAAPFDTVTFCLSKGLGAPVGSILVGSEETIRKARRWKRVLGGGMRQAGIIAAGGLYALRNNRERLLEDHQNATFLSQLLKELPEFELLPAGVNTNMVFVKFSGDPAIFNSQRLRDKGISLPGVHPRTRIMRFVTHLDVSRETILEAVSEIKALLAEHRNDSLRTQS